MKELHHYRQRLVDRCWSVGQEMRTTLEAFPEAVLRTGQDEETGWNVHQIAAHVRDVEAHAFMTAIQLLLEDRPSQDIPPSLPEFNSFQWMAVHYQPDEPLETILSDFLSQVQEKVGYVDTMPSEGWSRLGRHPACGLRTLQWWVEHSVAHAEEHLDQLRRMLGKADV